MIIIQGLEESLAWIGDADAIKQILSADDPATKDWYRDLLNRLPPQALLTAMSRHPQAKTRAAALPIIAKYPIGFARELARALTSDTEESIRKAAQDLVNSW